MNKGYRKHKVSRLFLLISSTFLIVLILFASISLYISVRSARNYSIEVNQELNWMLASNTVEVIKPDFENGTINKTAMEDIIHSTMVINPSVEVYILDPSGRILSYVAPVNQVKLENVNLEPILTFIKQKDHSIVYGDDPRNPGVEKIFSAAEIIENNKLLGYVYIVLASQEYESTAQMVLGSYILGYSIKSIFTILIVSSIVGLFLIWIITKRLNVIINGIRKFRSGNLKTRIPVHNQGELDDVAIVFNDMAATIEQNIEELKGIDSLRKELISNISHDLRTPIASIKGYAETLLIKGDISKEEQHNYYKIIDKSCQRLQNQVSDLFELSKLQADQVKLSIEPFSISELIHDIANEYRLISQKNGVSINTIVSKNVPLVEADISLIDRALQNLLNNALRFCKEGDTINIEIHDPITDGKRVKISISDSGQGISSEMLPNIFKRYYKGSDNKDSSGLGLAIVKKIMDLHSVSIDVSSIKGRGTIFSFDLFAQKVA